MTWKTGDRVQDKDGFTGTVTSQYDDVVEVTWDISGCTTDLKENLVSTMVPGQDDEEKQRRIWSDIFHED